MRSLSIGILDFGNSIQGSLELAASAEGLGYDFFWITEHHEPSTSHSSPLIWTAIVAGTTDSIRVGPAGVLLNHYPVLRVAEDFRALSALFPQRIDGGFCAGGVPPDIRACFADDIRERDYHEKASDLVRLTRGTAAPGERHADLVVPPAETSIPALWYLGGSRRSAEFAGVQSLRFGYALHFAFSSEDEGIFSHYRDHFARSAFEGEPQACLALAVACGETAEDARDICHRWAQAVLAPRIVGDPRHCGEQLVDYQRRYGVSRFALVCLPAEGESCLRAYERLARGLSER